MKDSDRENNWNLPSSINFRYCSTQIKFTLGLFPEHTLRD